MAGSTQVDSSDLRPTGPPQNDNATRIFQQRLDQRLAASDVRTDLRWRQLLAREAPRATADPFLPELAERLTNLARAGFDATLLVRSAAAVGPLPDDHPAAALWWRILDQLPETPNKDPATASYTPATSRRTTPSLDRQPPRPRLAPPPAFGPGRGNLAVTTPQMRRLAGAGCRAPTRVKYQGGASRRACRCAARHSAARGATQHNAAQFGRASVYGEALRGAQEPCHKPPLRIRCLPSR